MTITAPMSSMTSHLEEVDVEDVKKIQPGDYLTGVWRFGKFSEWCKQCAAEMDDHVCTFIYYSLARGT